MIPKPSDKPEDIRRGFTELGIAFDEGTAGTEPEISEEEFQIHLARRREAQKRQKQEEQTETGRADVTREFEQFQKQVH
jgi:hypothetical protein